MYCRIFELTNEQGDELVFQAQRRELATGQYSTIYRVADMHSHIFPVRATLDEALNDLKEQAMDGQVMRFVKPADVAIGSKTILSFTAGCAARIWIDTSATDNDLQHFTKEQSQAAGKFVSELYQGPFPLQDCHQIIAELKDKIQYLGIIKLGNAYNVAEIIYFEPTAMCSIKNGKLFINATQKDIAQRVNEWHENTANQNKELHDFVAMPFDAFHIYVDSPDQCVFLPSS